jgi:hypothetical protein
VSANASSTLTATVNTPNPPVDDPVTEGGVTHPIFQSNTETAQLMAVAAPTRFSGAGDRPIESGTPVGTVADSQAEMSCPPDHAKEVMDTVETWKRAIDIIKRVLDTVSPNVKEVYPAPFFSTIC